MKDDIKQTPVAAVPAQTGMPQPVQQPAPVAMRDQKITALIAEIYVAKSLARRDYLFEEVIKAWEAAPVAAPVAMPAANVQPFQQRVQPWMMACFGAEISADTKERNHRFFEESTELVQAQGMTASEAHQLVDYVYGRPVGEPAQEVGGVMVTLAALCLAQGMDMHAAGETELARIWTKVEAIRAKQAAKPKHSPLPQAMLPESGRDAALMDLQYDAGARAGYSAGAAGDDSFIEKMDRRVAGAVGVLKSAAHPANVAQTGSTGAQAACWCETCRPVRMWDNRMVLCPTCGNKRCPRGNDHRHDCTGSNEPGQPGSSYPAAVANQETPP